MTSKTIEEEFPYDVRIQERMLDKGEIQKDALKQRLEALADVADQSEIIDLDPPGVTPSPAASPAAAAPSSEG